MKKHLVVLPVLLLYSFYTTSYAQTAESSTDSTSFEMIMKQSNEELNESNYDEEVQRKYAQQFYQYYLDQPGAEHSEWAVVHSFKFWGNLGASDQVDNAIAGLSNDSEIWMHIIPYIPNAYYNSENKTIDEAIELLEKLKSKLTHPESKSMANRWLAYYYQDQNDTEKLTQAAREIIKLNANELHVNLALGYLHEMESLNIGQEAPKHEAETLQGEFLSLPPSDKITILEFWATWCGPCLPEIPHLKNLRSKYSEDELQIIGISLETDPQKVQQFIRDEEMTWPQISQPDEWSGELAKLYNVNGIPRSYIIGRDGKIIAKDLRGEELEEEIARLINQ